MKTGNSTEKEKEDEDGGEDDYLPTPPDNPEKDMQNDNQTTQEEERSEAESKLASEQSGNTKNRTRRAIRDGESLTSSESETGGKKKHQIVHRKAKKIQNIRRRADQNIHPSDAAARNRPDTSST